MGGLSQAPMGGITGNSAISIPPPTQTFSARYRSYDERRTILIHRNTAISITHPDTNSPDTNLSTQTLHTNQHKRSLRHKLSSTQIFFARAVRESYGQHEAPNPEGSGAWRLGLTRLQGA